MNAQPSFSDADHDAQLHHADRELAAFIEAVTKLYGFEHAGLSAEDWLNEAQEMDDPPRSDNRNWRAVTVAAAVRLASRLSKAAPVRLPE
jgi:hypothetical protein